MAKKLLRYQIEVEGHHYYCPVEVAMDVLGGKWRSVVLWYLQDETLRFTELKKRIVSVSEKVLIRELRALEHVGLVRREVYAQVPPRVEYSLTEYGQTLAPLLRAVSQFGTQYAERKGTIRTGPFPGKELLPHEE